MTQSTIAPANASANTPPCARRKLQFNSTEEVIAELHHLRATPYIRLGQWSLPQICRHLAMTIEMCLVPPPTDVPTPKQTALKNSFFAKVLNRSDASEVMAAPPALIPPADCGDADVDRLIAALRKLENYPQHCVSVGRCGPVPVEEIRPLHFAHAAHHLSFLLPVARRADLHYADADAAIHDIQQLRRGNIKLGNWTLAQACWHLNTALSFFMRPGPHPDPGLISDEARQKVQNILANGRIPSGIQAPERALPPATCGEADIDALIATLEKYQTFPGPFAPHPFFGKLSDEDARRHILIHCAHHLSYLVPTNVH